jgi:single-strand DNA-binding protein
MYQKVVIVGNLGKDPETKYTTAGNAVTNFSVATSERWKDKDGEKQERTEWFNCVAWSPLAEVIGEYLHKGSKVLIEGKMQTRSWESDGKTNYRTELHVREMKMLDSKPASEGSDSPRRAAAPAAKPAAKANQKQDDFDDDIPF